LESLCAYGALAGLWMVQISLRLINPLAPTSLRQRLRLGRPAFDRNGAKNQGCPTLAGNALQNKNINTILHANLKYIFQIACIKLHVSTNPKTGPQSSGMLLFVRTGESISSKGASTIQGGIHHPAVHPRVPGSKTQNHGGSDRNTALAIIHGAAMEWGDSLITGSSSAPGTLGR
jgi:hypothetical protein